MQSKLNLKEEKIWIAGHTGMVGQALKTRLRNYNLILSSRKELDLTDSHAVREWVDKHRPSIVFLTAAKVGGIKANANNPVDFLLDNLKIQNNVIEAAASFSVRKLMFMGSACSYPRDAKQPIDEGSLLTGMPEVTNIWYSTAKIAGIKLAQAFHSEKRLNCCIVMPTNSYGPYDNFDQENGHVIPALLKRFEYAKHNSEKSITIWGTGTPTRDFIYVDDLSSAMIFLMENYDNHEIINIGSGTELSIEKLAKKIAGVTEFKGEIVFDHNRPDGAPRKLLNSNKLYQLGWRPTINIDEGLKKMYDWARLNNKFND